MNALSSTVQTLSRKFQISGVIVIGVRPLKFTTEIMAALRCWARSYATQASSRSMKL